jgi:hypothetical protein
MDKMKLLRLAQPWEIHIGAPTNNGCFSTSVPFLEEFMSPDVQLCDLFLVNQIFLSIAFEDGRIGEGKCKGLSQRGPLGGASKDFTSR